MGIIKDIFTGRFFKNDLKGKNNPASGVSEYVKRQQEKQDAMMTWGKELVRKSNHDSLDPKDYPDEEDPYEKTYRDFVKEVEKRWGLDITKLEEPETLYKIEDLERKLQLDKKYIERTGFNPDAFPKDTKILYFDDVFHKLYDNYEEYVSGAKYVNANINAYLKNNGIERCCIELSKKRFLYYYPNNIENDAVEYNVSLVDKNNNVEKQLVYEKDGETINNNEELLELLKSDIQYLDLVEFAGHKKVRDYQPSLYANKKLLYKERIKIKNNILKELYRTHKYDNDSLKIIRDMLEKDEDIGLVINPCFNTAQRERILARIEIAKQEHDDQFIKSLRFFNTVTGAHLHKPFTEHEFAYIMDRIDHNDILDFDKPEKLAQLKLNYYKSQAKVSQFCEFEVGGRFFRLYNGSDYSKFSEFKVVECIIEDNKVVGTKPLYECKDGVETGNLDVLTKLLEEKYNLRDDKEIFQKAVADALTNISGIGKQERIRVLRTTSDAIIEIERIKEESEEEDFASAFFGNSNEKKEENAMGITITVISDGKRYAVYSDNPELGINSTLDEALKEIEKYGNLIDEDERTSSTINPDNIDMAYATETIDDKIEQARIENFKSLTEKKFERIEKKVKETQETWNMESNAPDFNNKINLLFVPYRKNLEDGTTFDVCNVYQLVDNERVPIYVREVTNDGIESQQGDVDAVLNILRNYDFGIGSINTPSYNKQQGYELM